jgi:hypothetical protein
MKFKPWLHIPIMGALGGAIYGATGGYNSVTQIGKNTGILPQNPNLFQKVATGTTLGSATTGVGAVLGVGAVAAGAALIGGGIAANKAGVFKYAGQGLANMGKNLFSKKTASKLGGKLGIAALGIGAVSAGVIGLAGGLDRLGLMGATSAVPGALQTFGESNFQGQSAKMPYSKGGGVDLSTDGINFALHNLRHGG